MANQTDSSRLEQRSVIEFLVAEKCKWFGIYRRIRNVYGEAGFSQKKRVYKWFNHEFTTIRLSGKNNL